MSPFCWRLSCSLEVVTKMWMKWGKYYDENRIFPIWAIFKHKQVDCMRRKMLFTFFKYLFRHFRSRDIRVFKICKWAKWWRHTLNQIFFKSDEKRYLSQFVSDIFGPCSRILLKCAPQHDLNSSVTMATYWVPDLPHMKSFLVTFGVPFWYLLFAFHMHDPVSI